MAGARHRKSGRWRRTRIVIAGLVVLVLVVFGRVSFHLARAAWRDGDVLHPAPAGYVDDASRMNLAPVSDAIDVPIDSSVAEREIIALLARARSQGLKISIAGARHTMGGHTIYPGGIALNMESFHRFELDETGEILHAQSGARWDQIIPYLDQRGRSILIMQSNSSFTVGGSISANCHGWQPNRPPIASSVIGFRLMKADGTIVRCSREENTELFSLVLGGYGLFGVILDVDLRVCANERYRAERFEIASSDYAEIFQREAKGQPSVGMAYGRLCVAPDRFLQEAVFNVFRQAPCAAPDIPALSAPSMASLKRTIFRGSVGSDYGKQLRWDAEKLLSDHLTSEFFSRNQLLSDGVELYENRTAESTDILHEYFVPPESFNAFVDRMREIIPRFNADLLNVTVRHVLADQDSFLCYADREMLALVLLFNQQRTPEADKRMETMTQELIGAALEVGGRYYLPYRLHATVDQFDRAYPQGREFFELKRKYDPDELFQNEFYLKYGKRE